jgi:hypothetical protein
MTVWKGDRGRSSSSCAGSVEKVSREKAVFLAVLKAMMAFKPAVILR